MTSEASYLHTKADGVHNESVVSLCREIADVLGEHFGTFLLLDIWAQPSNDRPRDELAASPAFEILTPNSSSLAATTRALEEMLSAVRIDGAGASVTTTPCESISPPGLPPLLPDDAPAGLAGCVSIGLAVKPIYRDPHSGEIFPLIMRQLRKQLAQAIRKTVAEFTGAGNRASVLHYQTLGPDSLSKTAGLVDQQLCEVSESFDSLVLSTPINVQQAWDSFEQSGFKSTPIFRYPPIPFHINLVKRQLFDIKIEDVEDPTLAHLFYEKQSEIDLELTALSQLETSSFLHSSIQLHGQVDQSLSHLAAEILSVPLSSDSPIDENSAAIETVDLKVVVEAAREELDYYHRQLPEFNATVEVCEQLASGLMVSQHRLLLARTLRLSRHRVDPLLHHEVGTHLLTYFNGRCQPLRQLYAGLASYEELQEGLAVLSEYLTGGLTNDRLRTLAGRVVAADQMIQGMPFSSTFALLHEQHGLSRWESFSTALRAYRGGGSSKDIVYLRGLRDLLCYLSRGHDLEPLYVGKMGLQHVPYIQELRRRRITKSPALLPRFWKSPETKSKLEAARGKTIVQLMETGK